MDLAEAKKWWESNIDGEQLPYKAARAIMALFAELDRLTTLCDEYRGEVERLHKDNEKLARGCAIAQGTYALSLDDITALTLENESLQSALTRARAEVTEFEKAKAYISGDRLGSYTLYGQWTLTADLTIEEIENSRYHTALERGRVEGMEESARIAETLYKPSIAAAIREACRLAEQANKGEKDA